MKKILTIFATALTMVFSFAFAKDKPIEIKVAYENHPGEPFDLVMNYWAELVDEESEGKIKFVLYPSSQLGDKKDVTEQAIMGFNVITLTDVGFLANYIPDLGVLFGPYLADDAQSLFKVYESDWFKNQSEALAKDHGIRIVMNNYLYGVRQLLANKPVRTPEDLKGLKIRVPNNIMQIKAMEAMGATPTPMPLAEAYPALTQGIIDGVENPLAVLYGQKIYEQAKYLNMISYLTNTSTLIAGEKFISSLPEGYADILYSTAKKAGLRSQEISAQNDAEYIQKMIDAGVEVVEPENVEDFRKLAMDVYTQFPEWSDGLYEQIQEELKK